MGEGAGQGAPPAFGRKYPRQFTAVCYIGGMKPLLPLAFLLLFGVPAVAQMQPPPPATIPFKKANALFIQTNDSARAAIRKVAGILQERGFAIDRIDYELLSITTKPKPYGASGLHTMYAMVSMAPSGLRLTGQWHAMVSGIEVTERAGLTNTASKKAFAELEAVAKAYTGATVRYDFLP